MDSSSEKRGGSADSFKSRNFFDNGYTIIIEH